MKASLSGAYGIQGEDFSTIHRIKESRGRSNAAPGLFSSASLSVARQTHLVRLHFAKGDFAAMIVPGKHRQDLTVGFKDPSHHNCEDSFNPALTFYECGT